MQENKDCINCKYRAKDYSTNAGDGSKQGVCEYRSLDAYNKIFENLPVWSKIKGDGFELIEKPPLKRSFRKENPYSNCQAWELRR